MHIIPVLDLKEGRAVHAVRGERERYAPVAGRLGSGHYPIELATAYRDRLGCDSCYVADLDAITGVGDNTELLRELVALDLVLWVDAGVSTPDDAEALLDIGVARVIVGSETLDEQQTLSTLAEQLPTERLVLSVDLLDGELRAPAGIDTPQQLVAVAAELGVDSFILLDLIRVGASIGPPLDLLAQLRPHVPNVSLYAGGGVRHRADLDALADAGAAGALVATAFHSGFLTAIDLHPYRQ